MPGISVILPVYQGEKYLKKCVESVQNQSFEDWELLIINDGSTDATAAIADECAAGDDRIRVFHRKKNSGVSEARNIGLNEAKGDFIAFLDADDRYEYKALETLLALLQSGADTAGCGHLFLSSDGSKSEMTLLPEGIYEEAAIREKIVTPLFGERLASPVFPGNVWRYLFSAKIIRNNGIKFTGSFKEDELFVLEYFCNAKKLAVTTQPLYRFFLNPSAARFRYRKDFDQAFRRYMTAKKALAAKYDLAALAPQWEANNNWAGLLAAVENVYSRENSLPARKKQKEVEALCKREDMAAAMAALDPVGLNPSRQMIANYLKGKHFFLLTQMFRLKFGI